MNPRTCDNPAPHNIYLEDHAVLANDRAGLDDARNERGSRPDEHPRADGEGRGEAGLQGGDRAEARALPHAAARPHLDQVIVSPQRRVVPDRGPVVELHVPNDGGGRRHESVGCNLRVLALERHHRAVLQHAPARGRRRGGRRIRRLEPGRRQRRRPGPRAQYPRRGPHRQFIRNPVSPQQKKSKVEVAVGGLSFLGKKKLNY